MEGAYTPEFTPVAQKGHVVELGDGSQTDTYRVERVAPLPRITTQTITVADGDRESNVDLENLEVWDDWFAQYRLPRLSTELPDDVTLQFDQGGSQAPLYQNQEQRGRITNEAVAEVVEDDNSNVEVNSLVHLLEQFVHEQETPEVTVENSSGAQVNVELTYAGWCYNITPVSAPDTQATYIPVESIRGR